MKAEGLRPGERWEWGVRHSQGLRTESSEGSARAALEWLLDGQKGSRRGTLVPYLVRRRVSEWEPADAAEART